MPLRNAYLRERQHAFYRQFVRPGSLVFDIGANEGAITKACLALGAKRVVAVEPVQSCVERLRMIHGPVTVVKAAAGATETTTRQVEVVTLNYLIVKCGWPDFIKIDVEGSELEVLSGLRYLTCPLTFGFNIDNLAVAKKCLALSLFKNAEFNFACDYQLMLDKWVGAGELLPLMTGTADICVRPK